MAVSIVRLGTDRFPEEGLRLGTVRRPPRGVRRTELARRNFYDVWLPLLAPSAAAVKAGRGAQSPRDWQRFVRTYRAEMKSAPARSTLALLAALSHTTAFSVGCYCADEARCHRSILRELLIEHGAAVTS